MKRTALMLSSAIFVALTSPVTFGGEWHSAGNSPIMPYHPKAPAAYRCHVTAMTSAADKQYRIDKDLDFTKELFSEPNSSGVAGYTTAGEEDPGMNGQYMGLRYSPDGEGGENLTLTLSTVIKTKSGELSSFSITTVPRTNGKIEGRSSLSISGKKARPAGVHAAEITASCVEVP
jgi:hypothetical protein